MSARRTPRGTQKSRLIIMLVFLALSAATYYFSKIQRPDRTGKPETSSTGSNLENYHDCGMEGSTKNSRIQELNRLKNRYSAPSDAEINHSITIDAMLTHGDDANRWKNSDGAEVIGYVYDVKVGGVETCNCKAEDVQFRDTHIELLADPAHSDGTDRVIVEVTPRWREIMSGQGTDWSTDVLRARFKGRWVKVRGWMMFDGEHDNQAENTAPGRERNWRATAWEIHPISGIEVVNRPLAQR